MRICSILGCENKYYCKGYCIKHYQKWYRHGDPLHTERESHGMNRTLEYRVWAAMKDRCSNQKNEGYKYYGGKGIIVCARWRNSFMAFYADMGTKPFPKAQIDRIDNNGNYTPQNCRWITAAENVRNNSHTKLTMAKAKMIRLLYCKPNIILDDLARAYNVTPGNISRIVNNKIWIRGTE